MFLQENIPENVIENTEQISIGDDDGSRDEMSSFKDLYHTLPNKISQSASNNLSVPIAFVCLLYLANEKVNIKYFRYFPNVVNGYRNSIDFNKRAKNDGETRSHWLGI